MAVALVALEPCNDHERALGTDHPDDVAEDVVDPPLLDGLVETFGEAVVDHRAEILAVDSVVAVGEQQFLGANQPQRIEQLRAEGIVARLAASERQQRDLRALTPTEHRQHAAVLVVRVRGRVQHAGRRAQLQQLLPGAGGPLIRHRVLPARRCRDGQRRRKESEGQRRKSAHSANCSLVRPTT